MKYPKLYVEVVLLDSMKGNVLVENKYFQGNGQGLSERKHPIFNEKGLSEWKHPNSNKKDNGQQQLERKDILRMCLGCLLSKSMS